MNSSDIIQAIMAAIWEYYFGIPKGYDLPNFNQSNDHEVLKEYAQVIKQHKETSKIRERHYYYGLGNTLYLVS